MSVASSLVNRIGRSKPCSRGRRGSSSRSAGSWRAGDRDRRRRARPRTTVDAKQVDVRVGVVGQGRRERDEGRLVVDVQVDPALAVLDEADPVRDRVEHEAAVELVAHRDDRVDHDACGGVGARLEHRVDLGAEACLALSARRRNGGSGERRGKRGGGHEGEGSSSAGRGTRAAHRSSSGTSGAYGAPPVDGPQEVVRPGRRPRPAARGRTWPTAMTRGPAPRRGRCGYRSRRRRARSARPAAARSRAGRSCT